MGKVTVMEERKRIKFTADGVDYTLEFTPYSIRKMEDEGFDFTKMEDRIVNVGYDIFAGAFISKHNYVPRKERDRLYEEVLMVNESGQNLIETLAGMLKDELEYIVNKPKGNVNWVMV